jgi:glutamate synthase (NADPH/NADH) small chain
VCPQESQCELLCVVNGKQQPVAIGNLERFAADWEAAHGLTKAAPPVTTRPERIAIIGSGPSGLTAACDLALLGYKVTVFEALHALGGVLRYGIPEFRLPKVILEEDIERLQAIGVEFQTNVVVGKTVTIDQLTDEMGFSAVFIGTGAGTPKFLGVPGENLKGVYSANEFLTRVNLMHARDFPRFDTPVHRGQRVAVIGAGDTAMDAVRTAIRLGAKEAHIVYRRTQEEMSAREEERHHAMEEGATFDWLTQPVGFVGDEQGWLRGMRCIRMELGEPDASGRRRPVPVEGSEFVMPIDTAVIALGTNPNPLVPQTTEGLQTNPHGCIVADEATGATTREGLYAGGDIVTGAATVILAMGAGRKAAAAIHTYLEAKSAT